MYKIRLLISCIFILIFLCVSLIYHETLLNYMDNWQFLTQNSKYYVFRHAETKWENNDNDNYNLVVENNLTPEDYIVHGTKHRMKRMLDPLQHEKLFETNMQIVNQGARNKRDKYELKKLQNDYKRCRKSAQNERPGQDCMLAFVRMYKTAKKFINEMEEMTDMLKEQTKNSESAESDESKEKKTTIKQNYFKSTETVEESNQATTTQNKFSSTETAEELNETTTTTKQNNYKSTETDIPLFKIIKLTTRSTSPTEPKSLTMHESTVSIDMSDKTILNSTLTDAATEFSSTTETSFQSTVTLKQSSAATITYSNCDNMQCTSTTTTDFISTNKIEDRSSTTVDDIEATTNSWRLAEHKNKSLENTLDNTVVLENQQQKQQQQLNDLIDSLESLNAKFMQETGPKLNPTNLNGLNDDAEFFSLCEYMAAHKMRNKLMQNLNILNKTNAASEYRAPMGFPVTGETMKATAQFMYNPSFGPPSMPICFYITPANMRFMQQMPIWTPNNYFAGISPGMFSYMSGAAPAASMNPQIMGNAGMFFMPPNFAATGNAQFMSGSAGGSQANIGSLFNKNVNNLKPVQFQQQQQQQQNNGAQPRQLFCTYMANQDTNNIQNQKLNNAEESGFMQINTKIRQNMHNKNATASDVIYASFMHTNDAETIRTDALPKCVLADHLPCFTNNECIESKNWCDSIVDCADGSDEAACTCRDRLPAERICDAYADCPLGEDEIGCFGCEQNMFSCYESLEHYELKNRSNVGMCYTRLNKCDGVNNCLNGRDELECSLIVSEKELLNSHVISSAEGYLYRNYRGSWYPVCRQAEKWAIDACAQEFSTDSAVTFTYREMSAPGPFIEPTLVGQFNFPQTCMMRNQNNAFTDHMPYVQCGEPKCGIRHAHSLSLPIKRRNRRQLSQIKLSNERIVGGALSKPHEWPFVVAIYRNGNFHCGGTIYSAHWIISAAHCVVNYAQYYYEVHAGLLRRTSYASSTQILTVSHVIMHDSYKRSTMTNDLALLRLAEPLQFNRWVKRICLPSFARTTQTSDWIWGPKEKTTCTVVGWGAIRERGPDSEQLRQVQLPIRAYCANNTICAGDEIGGRDACQGDSGGPLFCQSLQQTEEWYLAGVVSHGNGCARAGEYGVYTRIALYLNWFESVTLRAVTDLVAVRPQFNCPGYRCTWGLKRCIPATKRCDRIVHCLGGEDETGCNYDTANDLGSIRNGLLAADYLDYTEQETTTITYKNIESLNTESTTIVVEDKFIRATKTTLDGRHDVPLSTVQSTAKTYNKSSVTNTPVYTTTSPPFTVELLTQAVASSEEDEEDKEEEISTSLSSESAERTQLLGDSALQLPGKFICRKIPQIIELVNRCDRVRDCEDGTDELNCNCRDYLKHDLSVLICDGKPDCLDASDEKHCGNCPARQFYCARSATCVPRKQVCDKRANCLFEEDEQDCIALTHNGNIMLDANKQTLLKSAGTLSRQAQGIWRTVCIPHSNNEQKITQIANSACLSLGFSGVAYYNTSVFGSRQQYTPLSPELWSNSNAQHGADSSAERSIEHLLPKIKLDSPFAGCNTLYLECKQIVYSKAPYNTLRVQPNASMPATKYLTYQHKLIAAVEQASWPWLVDIYSNGALSCAGILLQQSWLLTQRYCLNTTSLTSNYLTALFGGSKTRTYEHFSAVEQIKRIDGWQLLTNAEFVALHLEEPVQLARNVLPIELWPLNETLSLNSTCIANLRDSETGGMRNLLIKSTENAQNCNGVCYRLLANEAFKNLSNAAINCNQFTDVTDKAAKGNYGILTCQSSLGYWQPASMFSFNNSECNAFSHSFPIKVFSKDILEQIHRIIDQTHAAQMLQLPVCHTHRCPLGQCLQQQQICDGKLDCHDGSDETENMCKSLKKECSATEFKCHDSTKCVPKVKFCDHVIDCEDLTDEPTVCSCFTYLRATSPEKICNGIRNCWDKSDESPVFCNCTEQHFTCKTGECLPQDFVCDKETDCPNGEDEQYCLSIKAPLTGKNKYRTATRWQSGNSRYKWPTAASGLLIEQSYGIWHTKCYARGAKPPTELEVRQLCKRLGYSSYRKPKYRLIDDESNVLRAAGEIFLLQEKGISVFGDEPLFEKYEPATKIVIATKFSPLHLNEELTLFMKPSRYIAQLMALNATESANCLRLELKCA